MLDNYISEKIYYGNIDYQGSHDWIKVTYNGLDTRNLIRSEIKGRKGRTAITYKFDPSYSS